MHSVTSELLKFVCFVFVTFAITAGITLLLYFQKRILLSNTQVNLFNLLTSFSQLGKQCNPPTYYEACTDRKSKLN